MVCATLLPDATVPAFVISASALALAQDVASGGAGRSAAPAALMLEWLATPSVVKAVGEELGGGESDEMRLLPYKVPCVTQHTERPAN